MANKPKLELVKYSTADSNGYPDGRISTAEMITRARSEKGEFDARIAEEVRRGIVESHSRLMVATDAANAIAECIENPSAPGSNLERVIEENPINALTLLILLQSAVINHSSKQRVEAALELHKGTAAGLVKPEIKKLWEQWVALPTKERKELYKGQHEFALAMEDKFYDAEEKKPRAAYTTIKNK